MPESEEAQTAISGMNGKQMKGRTLNVNEARPRSEERGGNMVGKRPGNRSRY